MMTNWDSYSSSRFSGYGFPSVPSAEISEDYRISYDDTKNEGNDEDDVLSSLRLMTMTSYKPTASISCKKSKASKYSKRSRMSMTNLDERDDYTGRVSMSATSDRREEDDVLASLPPTMVTNTSVYSKRSAALPTISQSMSEASPIPRDLVINSRKSNSSQCRKSISTQSRKAMSSNSQSLKRNASMSRSNVKEDCLEFWSALSVRAAMAVLKAGGSGKIAQEASNIVLATGRKQEGKQIDNKTFVFLSTKLALFVLEEGGNEKVASAVSSAVMASDEDDESYEDDGSDSLSGSFHIHSKQYSRAKVKSEPSPVTASIAAKRRQLKAKEIELEEKRRALEELERRSMQREKEVNEKWEATTEEPSGCTSKIRQIKRKEIDMEEKRKALQKLDRRNRQREKEINEKAAAKQKDEEEDIAQQQRLKDLEKQLNERKRELKRKEEERERKQKDVEQMSLAITEKELDANARLFVAQRRKLKEKEASIQLKTRMLEINKKEMEEMTFNMSNREREINNKLAAIRMAEEKRIQKEKEIEEKAKDFALKEQEINAKLATIEEASIRRRRDMDFAHKENEIRYRLATIDSASVARRQKEKVIEEKFMDFAQREHIIDERLSSIESASVVASQNRHMKGKETEMKEKLRLIELSKKEQLFREKNNALEEAMQLIIKSENEIRERMAALDAATSELLNKANAVPSGGENVPADSTSYISEVKTEEDWYPQTNVLKPIAPELKEKPLSLFEQCTHNISKAVGFPSTNDIAKAFDHFLCSGGSASASYLPKELDEESDTLDFSGRRRGAPERSGHNINVPIQTPRAKHNVPIQTPRAHNWQKNNPTKSLISEETLRQQKSSGSKAINDSLNQALKAYMQLYSPSEGRDTSPLKQSSKIVSSNPHRGKAPSISSTKLVSMKKKKGFLKSVFGKKKTGQRSKGYKVSHEM